VSRLLSAAAACGIDVEELCAESGLAPGGGVEPAMAPTADDARVPMARVFTLWDGLLERQPPPRLLAELTRAMHLECAGPLGFAALTAPDLGAGLQVLLGEFSLITDSGHWRIREHGQWVRLEWQREARSPGQTAANDAVLAHLVDALARIGAGESLPLRLELCGPHWRGRLPLESALGIPLRHGAASNAAILPSALMRRPMPFAHAGMHAAWLEAVAALQARRAPASASTREQLRVLLLSMEAMDELDAAELARRLGCSLRGLHRRLAAEGCRLGEEIERVRQRRAVHGLVCSGQSVLALALELGFADASTFGRAFRRWFGLSPAAFRRRARVDAPDDLAQSAQ
jgi:AraC-like DNA-binding protein